MAIRVVFIGNRASANNALATVMGIFMVIRYLFVLGFYCLGFGGEAIVSC